MYILVHRLFRQRRYKFVRAFIASCLLCVYAQPVCLGTQGVIMFEYVIAVLLHVKKEGLAKTHEQLN